MLFRSVANVTDPDSNAGAMLRVWGLGLQDLGSASDLNGLNVVLSAGMSKGLPLANPAQAGVIMRGQIQQAFGNWIGIDQTLDMIFVAGGAASGSVDQPGNFPFSMPAGTTMAKAIANTLAIAMPNVPPTISISPNLTLNYDVTGHYESLAIFSSFVNALSRGIIGGTDYPGVTIAFTDGSSLNVFDGLGPAPIVGAPVVKAISFQDLIGQPTWIAPATISVKTVLRADLHVGDTVSIPPSLVTTTSAAQTAYRDKTTFSGNFLVQQVHHYGHSRQPDAASWNTTYQMAAIPKQDTVIPNIPVQDRIS